VSCIMFHGPNAREMVLKRAHELGRLLAKPYGDDGLKVGTSRQIVEMLSAVPVGDKLGVVVIGPMDKAASSEAVDALLKTLEEFDSRYLQPLLWATDAAAVIGTVRSRCLEEWCPQEGNVTPENPYLPAATALCEAALRRRVSSVISLLKENEGSEDMILRAAAEVLATKQDWSLKARLKLWENLRPYLKTPRPSSRMALAAFLV